MDGVTAAEARSLFVDQKRPLAREAPLGRGERVLGREHKLPIVSLTAEAGVGVVAAVA